MAKDAVERQREFKARMYAKGLTQKIIWVPSKGSKTIALDRSEFIRRLDVLTVELPAGKAKKLYRTLLKTAKEMIGEQKKKKE